MLMKNIFLISINIDKNTLKETVIRELREREREREREIERERMYVCVFVWGRFKNLGVGLCHFEERYFNQRKTYISVARYGFYY